MKSNVAINILKETGLSVVENEEIQQLNKSPVPTSISNNVNYVIDINY
jgi:hypothetical protein